MSRVHLSFRHLHAIDRHALMSYPEECCGILMGRRPRDEEGKVVVERVLMAANGAAEPRRTHYRIAPKTLLAAHRQARALNLDLVGYYHSHPDNPAVPSEVDREEAWPGVSYLIVSVQGRRVAEHRSWQLDEAGTGFEEEEIVDLGLAPSFQGNEFAKADLDLKQNAGENAPAQHPERHP
jgi:proteasome lid subunit RPN8/RPN11